MSSLKIVSLIQALTSIPNLHVSFAFAFTLFTMFFNFKTAAVVSAVAVAVKRL